MKFIFTFGLLLCYSIINAQDTLFLNKDYKKVSRDNAFYIETNQRNPSAENEIIRRTYWINGQIKSERSFVEKDKDLIRNGISKYWYDNGQLFYQETYRKGERHGELIGYWEDGSKRRHDIFSKGKLKSGKVWDRNGDEREHFPIMEKASFPGGEKALAAYLKHSLPVPETQAKNTLVKVVVKFVINKEGYVGKIDIIEGAPHWYNTVTVNALSKMPKWNPAKQFGEPVNVSYTLPVIFRK
ncbi:energy transducer TonB [Salinimicrobium oceani]|uniref:TonB C-terminal domain-containing protein n=1 Tax=Salinimicrobium oceani TaxID=2722702 RepID=A0ABX1CSK1_9FLAO|nr:energy transducer TonB [Salinimicrobium oceani]NJW51303.1 hypothetical protein [Salinimicrobium oceani]